MPDIPKMKLESPDLTRVNIDKLAELFPSVITESRDEKGEIKKAVNFEALRKLLSSEIADGDEAYEFTWPGKKAAIAEAGRPIRKTLRPCPQESKNWDTTENLYIEGDNLDVLKLLQENYLGKVKMIYIDPPYNTGNDFIYRDNFAIDKEEYQEKSGEFAENEDGEKQRLFKNTDSNGRFHSDWCSMIYPRLMLARNLLSEDGVIFISCDDNEQDNLKKICDEVFGRENFIANFIWEKKKKPSFLNINLGNKTEYIITYAKERPHTSALSVDVTEAGKKYPLNNAGNTIADIKFPPNSVKFNIPDCTIVPQDMSEGNIITQLITSVTIVDGYNKNEFALRGEWRYSQNKIDTIIKEGEQIVISKIPFRPNHIKMGGDIKKIHNLLTISTYNVGTNEDASFEQIELFRKSYFDFTKPTGLIHFFIKSLTYNDPNSIIFDFFSGSATTAHAVMQLNAEDGGKRKFIMVQLPEICAPDSEAAKAGYNNICEIGKERIRRAGEKIKKENADKPGIENLDIGFRVLKCDSSNMKDVYYAPKDTTQNNLDNLISNIKEDRSDLDLFFGCLVEWGLPLSLPYKTEDICGYPVHFYDHAQGDSPALAACFDANIGEEAIKEIARRKPLRAVFRDSGFATSEERINAGELFKNYAPDTVVKIL